MADTFAFDKEHLTNMKTTIENLKTDLMNDPKIVELQEWGTTTLWDPSTWNSKTGGGSDASGGGTPVLTLLPGNPETFPAAKLLVTRGGVYASGVINAVNWVHDVLTTFASNIDFTIHKVEGAEKDNELTVDQAIGDFTSTIGNLGGAPTPTTNPPTVTTK